MPNTTVWVFSHCFILYHNILFRQYLFEEKRIPYSVSATFFWGTDVDPIVMLITVGNLLSQADYDDWHTISSHFRLGNPLVFTAAEGNLRVKHDMFALGRFYAPAMGINFNKKDFFVPFDIVLGNPPWEKIRFEERKFFSSYSPEISNLAKKRRAEFSLRPCVFCTNLLVRIFLKEMA